MAEDYGLTDDRLRLRDKNPAAYAGFQERLAMRALNGPLQTLRRTVTGRPLLADLAAQLGAMEVPTLIVTGDEDHVCIDTSLYLKRLLPAAGLCPSFPRPATPSIWKSRSSSIAPSMHSSALSRLAAGRRRPMRHAHRTDAEFHLRTDVGMSRNASCPWDSLFLVSAPPRPRDRKQLALPACPIWPCVSSFRGIGFPERYTTCAKRLDTSCFGVDRHRTMNARREHRTSVRREH